MLRFLRQTAALLAALEDPRAFARRYGADVSNCPELARATVRAGLAQLETSGARPPWVAYLAIDADTQVVVGACSFAGAPTADPSASVSIAYTTFTPFEGLGYATKMVRKLVEIAVASGKVEQLLARTLPARSGSTRVLTKAGFEFVGPVEDPDEGLRWRWRRSVRRRPVGPTQTPSGSS